MTLSKRLDLITEELKSSCSTNISLQKLISVIDLTCLDLAATPDEIGALGKKGVDAGVAAVCIYPQHLDCISPYLNITRATVVNFPSGDESESDVVHSIQQIANQHRVDEIDYVFPYKTYLEGQHDAALAHCFAAYSQSKDQGLLFKVIIETGAFESLDSIYNASLKIIQSGCDFLKTSTGKIQTGATLPAAFAILAAIRDSQSSCGVKLSGGIKTVEQALSYANLAQHMLHKSPEKTWFRLGASGLLDTLLRSSDKVAS